MVLYRKGVYVSGKKKNVLRENCDREKYKQMTTLSLEHVRKSS